MIMRTPSWNPQLLTTIDNVDFTLHFEGEHLNAKDHFMNECGMSPSEYKEINNFYWFVARIEATKGGEVLADSYLGGNCYKSLNDVMQDKQLDNVLSGYAPQMIEECQEEAHIALQLLIERKEQQLINLKG